MPKLIANELELEYDEFGSPHAPAILLIMGLGMQMLAWSDDFCTRLAEPGYRVIRFDNRDVGLSEKIHGQKAPGALKLLSALFLKRKVKVPYTLEDMAQDSIEVLNALQIEEAHVVGASMGGMISQILTASHPQRVLSLTSIMSSSGRRHLPRPNRTVLKQLFLGRPAKDDKEAQIWHTVKTFQMIGSRAYPRNEKAMYKMVEALYERSYYKQGFFRQAAAIIANGNRVKYLKKIETPTLIIHGNEDSLVPVEHGVDTAKYIADAKLEIIDGMGHDLPPNLVPELTEILLDHFSEATS